jgi:uncharacterized protein YabN with tetrapyrrole methylase and pyrophosphatase domain
MCIPDKNILRELGENLKKNPRFDSIVTLIDTLLGEQGCPWDRSRTVADFPKYLKGEVDEVVDAVERGDNVNLEEELGDLLFVVVMAIRVAEKEGRLDIDGVFRRIIDKMVFRHPHVFGGDMEATTADQVLDNWQILKAQEKDKPGTGV